MRFKIIIIYDKPGRIRFLCGGYVFYEALETAVQKFVSDHTAAIFPTVINISL